MNCGQVCISPKRIFVEDDIADSFIEGFVKKTRELVIGNGLDPGTDIGRWSVWYNERNSNCK